MRFLLFLLALAHGVDVRPGAAQEPAQMGVPGASGQARPGGLWFGPPPQVVPPDSLPDVCNTAPPELCLPPVCDDCANWQLVPFFGYDSWRGVADGTWQHNGLHTGANFGTRLGQLSDWTGIGLQVGGSAGVYDWAGTDYRLHNANETLTQGFLTYGLFRRPVGDSRIIAAVAGDWMFNDNFSVFGQDPSLSQWRGQLGYVINDWHEAGVWGAFRGQTATRDVPDWGPVSWRAVNQLSAYWHAKWSPGGADTVIWLGVPESDRLTGDGSLADYFVGASAQLPLGERIAAYTMVSYLHPSASAGETGAKEDSWVFFMGLAFYPRHDARSGTVVGRRWAPLLPVANNGLFLVDASANY